MTPKAIMPRPMEVLVLRFAAVLSSVDSSNRPSLDLPARRQMLRVEMQRLEQAILVPAPSLGAVAGDEVDVVVRQLRDRKSAGAVGARLAYFLPHAGVHLLLQQLLLQGAGNSLRPR